jgi:hypothetical protein
MRLPPPWLTAILAVLALFLGLAGFRAVAHDAVARRIERAAAARGMNAAWSDLDVSFMGQVALADLSLTGAAGDTAFRARSLHVALDPWSLLTLRPRVKSLVLAHSSAQIRRMSSAEADTVLPEEPTRDQKRAERAARLQRSAESLVRLLLAPARRSPRVALRDLTLETTRSDDALFGQARLMWLAVVPSRSGIRLEARGSIGRGGEIPFDIALDYGHDDRITGGARFVVPASGGRPSETLRLAVEGRAHQDRRAGVVRLEEGSRASIGKIPFALSGAVARRGPRFQFQLAADSLTEDRLIENVPRALFGPLTRLSVHGSFDYRLGLDLDLARPDSVSFTADVIPHGLRIDPRGTTLPILGLDQPFVATIHLPRTVVQRDLSPANLHFRPLDRIDPFLVNAVLTNEDGSFFRHRGFNVEAVKRAIAENVKAGAYRRGAGTITMQLARNLYLGHERTLSRKAQEVVLAWTLEHLTGISKPRLLEIYLNIIEWGPGVHGASEAARFYFDRDCGRLTIDEALFLSTVIPAPSRWRWRFGPDGELKSYARAQMHFIGRAMVARGWLEPDALPPADLLHVELRGRARDAMFPPADTTVIEERSVALPRGDVPPEG